MTTSSSRSSTIRSSMSNAVRNTNTMKNDFFLQQLASIYVYKLSKMVFFSKFLVCLGIKGHTPGAAPEQRGWRRGGVQWRPPTRACARSGGRGRRRRGRRTSTAAALAGTTALGDVGSRGGALGGDVDGGGARGARAVGGAGERTAGGRKGEGGRKLGNIWGAFCPG